VLDPALLAVRPFAWANVTAVVFSVPFAAVLLANILYLQQVWGYSAIRTGLAVAIGPLLVPVASVVAHRLRHRVPTGVVVAVGCLLFGAGSALNAVLVTVRPDYTGSFLLSAAVGGIGVGLALPTILSSATADLPPGRSATGSAVVTMSRQLGTVLGVCVLVAVLGTPDSAEAAHAVFRHAWVTLAAVAVVGALVAPRMTPVRAADAPRPARPAPAARELSTTEGRSW
jgi:MFS family permease